MCVHIYIYLYIHTYNIHKHKMELYSCIIHYKEGVHNPKTGRWEGGGGVIMAESLETTELECSLA